MTGRRNDDPAALAGAPQVVIPVDEYQHYWAQRVHTLGIGTAHAPATIDSLTSVSSTLQQEVITGAQSVAAAVRSDDADRAVVARLEIDSGRA